MSLRVIHKGENYEVDLDDSVDPVGLATEFARAAGIVSESGGAFRFAMVEGKGLSNGSVLELVEMPPLSPVTIRRGR